MKWKDVSFPLIYIKVECNFNQNLKRIFVENRMVIVKCLCECQRLSYIPDIKADYKATVTRQCGVSATWCGANRRSMNTGQHEEGGLVCGISDTQCGDNGGFFCGWCLNNQISVFVFSPLSHLPRNPFQEDHRYKCERQNSNNTPRNHRRPEPGVR